MITSYAPAGKNGKDGKDGKDAKATSVTKNKDKTDGDHGSICFNIYDETGLVASGGRPFRVVMNKSELKKQLQAPYCLISESVCKDQPIIFGEYLCFGPVLPINIGPLAAPEPSLWGELSGTFVNGRSFSFTGLITFPTIPPEVSTKYGQLHSSESRTISIKIPRVSELGFALDKSGWPWISQSGAFSMKGKFRTYFVIGKYVSRASETDGEYAAEKSKYMIVEISILCIKTYFS